MKKIIYGACAALVLMASACSKSDKAGETTMPKELSDSVTVAYGSVVGGYIYNDFNRFSDSLQTDQTKKDIIKGIQLAFANGDDDGVLMGMQIGAQMMKEIQNFEDQGLEINRAEVLNNLRREFLSDSLDMTKIRMYSEQMNQFMRQVEEIKAKAEEQRLNEAPEAQQNVLAGKAYVDKLKASDPEIKTTESGLSYKIINPGDETKPTDSNSVTVDYTGKLIDGTVFDSSIERGEPATFPVRGVVPGFAEGLKLLGKGGKAILYIPGELAYGPKGAPQAGIGPNSMLVFEVEVHEIQ